MQRPKQPQEDQSNLSTHMVHQATRPEYRNGLKLGERATFVHLDLEREAITTSTYQGNATDPNEALTTLRRPASQRDGRQRYTLPSHHNLHTAYEQTGKKPL